MDDRVATKADEGPAARPLGTGRKVLFSAMKNEAPFLLEWVAYHKAIGFDDIVICSNPSNDGTDELLAALAGAGEITHLQAVVPKGASPQYMATQAFEREVGFRDGDWYLWLDADEFLNVHVGDRTVGALIQAMGDKQVALINWRNFGSNGHTSFPGRFTDPAFTGAAKPGLNRALKSLFRFSPRLRGFARHGIHRPLVAADGGLAADDVLMGNGKTPPANDLRHARWLGGEDFVLTSTVAPDQTGWALAQVNHYMVRTPEFFALKALRGRGYLPRSGVKKDTRHTKEFFAANDRNEAEDRTILHWQDAVTDGISRLVAVPAIAEADRAARAKVQSLLQGVAGADGEAKAEVHAPPAAATGPRKVLFSAMKNEAPFLLEWVAYHKVIGFDEIVICSNPSNDGTEELLAALAEAGEITHLRAVPTEKLPPQGAASKAFSHEVGYRNGDWYLWLDADEFLNVHVGDRTVDALIAAAAGKVCLMINWRIFGTSGNPTFPGRFISPAFSRAALFKFRHNKHIKSLFQMRDGVVGFGVEGIHRPLLSPDNKFELDDFLTGSGKSPKPPGTSHRRWMAGADSGRYHSTFWAEKGWALAQINHYLVRTQEHFALKRLRGRGWVSAATTAKNPRHTDEFFIRNDRNEAEDRTILHWQQPVSDEIKRLTQVPAIAEAAALASTKVEEIMAQISEPAAIPPVPEAKAEVKAPATTFKLTFPAAESRFVTDAYAKAGTILEYGSGGSTELAAKAGARVISVESDKAWAERLQAVLAGISDRALVHHVDIGRTTDWGRPRTAEGYTRYPSYALSVWDRPDLGDPDLVLIDGRFRAACLAAVVMRARKPTTVLFDDYVERPYYHAVEKLAVKEEVIGRMARFTVTPGPIPPEMLTQVIGWFSDWR